MISGGIEINSFKLYWYKEQNMETIPRLKDAAN